MGLLALVIGLYKVIRGYLGVYRVLYVDLQQVDLRDEPCERSPAFPIIPSQSPPYLNPKTIQNNWLLGCYIYIYRVLGYDSTYF